MTGQYASFHSNVIGATSGEAPFVLDGLMGNAAQFNPLVHYVDTGGVSDHVFAMFHLLGHKLVPQLSCFGKPSAWKGLSSIIEKPINEEAILRPRGDIVRLAASVKSGSVKPSTLLRKLGAYRQQNRLYLALGEIGRIERTLFMLDWTQNPKLRQECQAGLNKGRHVILWQKLYLLIPRGVFMIDPQTLNKSGQWPLILLLQRLFTGIRATSIRRRTISDKAIIYQIQTY
ncbi:Tn3 family transposase [Pseudovibrio sp. Tun.PSC04-5.I4]|uniref:Tn3 family transposase n=1 Tax=Pseudovibrio sp. Tun.PSC04-5.I4 TaxID=1798213 RepID=UPI000A6B8398|nr:Tn3 family transposase [Pseudovibrio sp. Tun.PSC04-5.I4]